MINSMLKALVLRYIESKGRDFISYSEDVPVSQRLFSRHHIDGVSCEEDVESSQERVSAWRYHSVVKPLPSSILGVAYGRMSMLERLKKVLSAPDEGFSERLFRFIRESGMSETDCYKRAHIDRKLFSKIRGDLHYRPRKQTVLAFAIALELDEEKTKELLAAAGFALSSSDRFDLAISYFIRDSFYDIMVINELLLDLDLPLLGS